MTGICGWSNAKPDGTDERQRIQRMCATLRSNRPATFALLGHAAVGCSNSNASLVVSNDPTIAVAIEGHPQWRDKDVNRMASDLGPARALLALYIRYGDECLKQLGGSFAIAIADQRKNRLILAIDRMGVRPMCYAENARGQLTFGTVTYAILAGGVSDELSPQALYNYVYFHVIPSPRTVFTGIQKLEPGQRLVHGDGETRIDHYWAPQFGSKTVATSDELRRDLFETTRTAVARCMSGPASACFLSGGLDSSTVAGLAIASSNERVRAYSIGFAQAGYDEMEFARIAAKHFGLDHREYYVTPDDVAKSMHLIAEVYDEPFGNSSAVPAYFCARRAADDGVTRLLAGDGGDELFAGNDRYAKQRIFEFYNRVPSWARRYLVEPLVSKFASDRYLLIHKLQRYVEQAQVPMPERLETYNYLQLNKPSDIFDGEFLACVDADRPIEELKSWYDRSAGRDFVDRMLLLDWKLTLADNDLRKVNRMCESAGVDVCYPFLDDDLVAMSMRIPTKLKMKRNRLRAFYKDTFSQFLPNQIITKEKHGFGLPFGEWLVTSRPLQDVVFPSITRLRGRRLFNDSFLDNLLRMHRDEHAAYYGSIIWVITMLDHWLEARTNAQVLAINQ